MIRKWLRALIGWDEFLDWASIEQHNSSISQGKIQSFEMRVNDLQKEIEALKYMRTQREARAIRRTPDWEQVQADFAADPKNFEVPANLKEN